MILGLAAATAALFLLSCIYLSRRQALSKGCNSVIRHRSWEPFSALDFHMAMYTDVRLLHRHHQLYGNTFSISNLLGLPTIVTIAPENIRAINAGREWGIEPLRLAGMEDFCGRAFLTTDGEAALESRKLIKPAFAKGNLSNLGFLDSEVDRLIERLPRRGETVDLKPLFYTMFLNSSMKFVLGIDQKEELPENAAPHTIDTFLTAFHSALFLTSIRILLGRAWRIFPQRRYRNACKTVHEFVDYYITKAASENDINDTISLTLAVDAKSSPLSTTTTATSSSSSLLSLLSHESQPQPHLLQSIMASQETTSALLTNIFFLLSRHPKYFTQLRSTILSKPPSFFTFDNLLAFAPIQNIISETLRLYPIFPLLARTALCDTTLPSGSGSGSGTLQSNPIYAPKGTLVAMSYFALHRNTAIFGEDVESFRPERWEKIHRSQWEFMGFGAGSRACLGQQKVRVEAAFVLGRLVGRFEGLESRDEREWVGEMGLTCQSGNGCLVAFGEGRGEGF